MKARILVVDDEKLERIFIDEMLRRADFEVHVAANAFQAIGILSGESIDVALVDLLLPGMDGLDLLKEIKQRWPRTDVILITAHGTVETAVASMKKGAHDFLEKPVSSEVLLARIEKVVAERVTRGEADRLRERLDAILGPEGFVAQSPSTRTAVEKALAVRDHPGVILLVGETGTGKDTLAQIVHSRSIRRDGPFVKLNCAVLGREVIESELFGHESGAFTGAVRRHVGCFERAQGGTLFLDDVDDVPPEIQVKLLRVVEEQSFERVGGEETVRLNCRIIAATKCDLADLLRAGRFRSDLFYRISGLQVYLPPLRERPEEILLLLEHYLGTLGQAVKIAVTDFSPEAIRALQTYRWPGNVRELRRFCECLLALSPDPPVGVGKVRAFLPGIPVADRGPVRVDIDGLRTISLQDAVDEVEGRLIRWALERAHGNQVQAAASLGIPRSTFQSKWARLQGVAGKPGKQGPANP